MKPYFLILLTSISLVSCDVLEGEDLVLNQSEIPVEINDFVDIHFTDHKILKS